MASTYRMTVPGESDAQQAELRLGSYMSGDDGFPLNYTGDKTSSTGVLMTTKGEFALVSGKPLFAQAQKTVDINVSSGNFTLEAAEGLTVTGQSLYLQSGKPVTANSDVPSVGSGNASIVADSTFTAHSNGADVKIYCEEGGYSSHMHSGWLEVWGNKRSQTSTDMSITLVELIKIPVVFKFSYTSYSCSMKGFLNGLSGSASSMTAFSSSAIGVELEKKDVVAKIDGIKTGAALLKTKVVGLFSNTDGASLDNSVAQVDNEDISSNLSGVRNDMNVVQIRTE